MWLPLAAFYPGALSEDELAKTKVTGPPAEITQAPLQLLLLLLRMLRHRYQQIKHHRAAAARFASNFLKQRHLSSTAVSEHMQSEQERCDRDDRLRQLSVECSHLAGFIGKAIALLSCIQH